MNNYKKIIEFFPLQDDDLVVLMTVSVVKNVMLKYRDKRTSINYSSNSTFSIEYERAMICKLAELVHEINLDNSNSISAEHFLYRKFQIAKIN
ncbi:hypothetical protein BpHYR1_022219 [Brachionus plicatilis]|uniref:Uncharacterized protein n=1 Tax=Brachionus plicatilis TaxID=10195 RepID=A0A3M7Q6D1_BRAPC|nr:hypothetical protein BpHYR1_022219 [Brachionus plicatilis]